MLKSLLLSAGLYLPESLAQWYTRPALIIDGRKRDLKAQILGDIFAENSTPTSGWNAQELRHNMELGAGVWDLYPPPNTYSTQDILLSEQLKARRYSPSPSHKTTLQTQSSILYFHGGGMVIGSINTHDALCSRLCYKSGLSVISVDYRLAPEHRFPAGLEDAQTAYSGLIQQANTLELDPHQIIVAGDSAGGNLVAALIHQLQSQHREPLPKAQILIYPWTDLQMDSPSLHSLSQAPVISYESIQWFQEQYLSRESQLADPRISPIYSEYLAGQPPAYILTCGHDPLRDMGQTYAHQLERAGVEVTQVEYPGQIHGFLQFAKVIPEAEIALDKIVEWLKTEAERIQNLTRNQTQ